MWEAQHQKRSDDDMISKMGPSAGTTGESGSTINSKMNKAGIQTYLNPVIQMDEHTDWVNQLIYLQHCESG